MSSNSGKMVAQKSKFVYWLAGWIMIIRHPIRSPRDFARAADLLAGDIDRIRQ